MLAKDLLNPLLVVDTSPSTQGRWPQSTRVREEREPPGCSGMGALARYIMLSQPAMFGCNRPFNETGKNGAVLSGDGTVLEKKTGIRVPKVVSYLLLSHVGASLVVFS